MLKKAIIEQVIDNYTVKVRIPEFNGIKSEYNSSKTEDLTSAIVCTIPNSDILFKSGDVVIIGFENDDYLKPIILGFLYTDKKPKSLLSANINELNIEDRVFLGKNAKLVNDSEQTLQQRLNEIHQNIIDLKKSIGLEIFDKIETSGTILTTANIGDLLGYAEDVEL